MARERFSVAGVGGDSSCADGFQALPSSPLQFSSRNYCDWIKDIVQENLGFLLILRRGPFLYRGANEKCHFQERGYYIDHRICDLPLTNSEPCMRIYI
eukprot:623432-Pleurochrysis_carterae.AAC.1